MLIEIDLTEQQTVSYPRNSDTDVSYDLLSSDL
jgi:hypothetical protein